MKKILYLLFAILLATACSSEKKAGQHKATAKAQSAPYELLIVADKEWLKTQSGEAFTNAIAPPIEGLPQLEPSFRVMSVNPSAFTGTFRTYSNVVCVEISKKYKEVSTSIAEDVYCTPQAILTITAPDNESLMNYLSSEEMKQIVYFLNGREVERERKILEKHYSNVVNKQAQKLFGAGIKAPQDIDQVKAGKNFLWGSASKQEFRLNVCIYSLPLKDVTVEDFISARDSVMKVNIPGEREDQWMETDPRTVVADVYNIEGKDVLEVRGLWDMRNDAMGGPFIAYVQADNANNRLLVSEGFVFAPEEKKRPLIRELEAMLQTMILK